MEYFTSFCRLRQERIRRVQNGAYVLRGYYADTVRSVYLSADELDPFKCGGSILLKAGYDELRPGDGDFGKNILTYMKKSSRITEGGGSGTNKSVL